MRIASCAVVLASLAIAAPAVAQSVRGHLVDADTRQPIATGEVALLWGEEGNRAVFTATTDTTGAFVMRAKQPGQYRLRGRRIGYEEVISPPFDLGTGSLEVELSMSAAAVPLAPLTIVARGTSGENLRLLSAGYYERKHTWGREGLGMGYFLDAADLERRQYLRVTQVLQEVPGLHVVGCGGSAVCIALTRPPTSLLARSSTGGNPQAAAAVSCTPSYYLDGQLLRLAHGETIDEVVPVLSVAAIEVYPSNAVPAQFANMVEQPCGAIALWTGPRDEGRDTTAARKH